MYKVKPEHEIARFRTISQAAKLMDRQDTHKSATGKKTQKLWNKFGKLAAKIEKHEQLMDLVAMAYKLADDANGVNARYSVCQRGCAHCCKVNVEITTAEALYIEQMTGHKVEKSYYNLPPESPEIDYCPMLNQDNGECSIYEHRPMACRSFFTFDDVKYCVDSSVNHQVTSLRGKPPLLHIQKALSEIAQDSDGKKFGDIRSFFK